MIRDRREEVLRLHATFSRQEQAQRTGEYRPSTSVLRRDEEVIEKARSEKNGKFDRIWQGDISDYGHDHSAADDGFVHKLWSYTQDEEQVKRIHALSGLHRAEKSGHRPDYLRRSIERAKKNVTWFYNWPEASEKADSEVWEPEEAQMLSDHPKETEFGQNELLPLKTPEQIIEAASDGTDYIVEGGLSSTAC